MSITGELIRFVTGLSAKRIEAATKDPMAAQTDKLMSMLQNNADTEYGKRHGFGAIRSVADYQKNIPIITYNDIQADMDRVTEGAKNVFTAEDPVMFAQTSGTTGKPKFIPVTPTDRGRAHSDVMRTWLWHVMKDHSDVFDEMVVALVSPAVEGHAPSGLPYGSTSGDMYRNLPWLITRMYSIPYEVFEIEDYQARYYAIMRTAIADQVRFLNTANPSSILKMCEKGDEFSKEIIKDIRDGTMSKTVEISTEIREAIAPRYRPNPGRAGQLEQMRQQRDGKLVPGDYWPNLSVIACWKGGTVGHYIDKFGQWFDPDGRRPVPVRDYGYLSSECRGSIPLSDDGSKGVLTVGSNFFEFVPVDGLQGDDWTQWDFKTVDQLEQGQEYYIFVSTTSGLYRYDINDIISVEGYYNATPEIVFRRKGRGMTNITGEKLSVNQVIDAVNQASSDAGAIVRHFKGEADPPNSRYVFRVELADEADASVTRTLLQSIDTNLKNENIEYKAKRDSQRLAAPVLHVMREGWYERQRREQVAKGGRAFQAKTELLSASKMATTEVRPELVEVVEMAE